MTEAGTRGLTTGTSRLSPPTEPSCWTGWTRRRAKPSSICGCGTGELAATIAETGATVIGIDSDPAMIEAARLRLPDADLRVTDAHDFTVERPVDACSPMRPCIGCPHRSRSSGACPTRFAMAAGSLPRWAPRATSRPSRAPSTKPAARLVCRTTLAVVFPSPAQYAAMLEDAGFEIRELDFRDRPTRLAGVDGLAGWLQISPAVFSPTCRPTYLPGPPMSPGPSSGATMHGGLTTGGSASAP